MVKYIQKEMEKKGIEFLFNTTLIEVVDKGGKKENKDRKKE